MAQQVCGNGQRQGGYILLLSVLIAGAIGVSLSVSLIQLGLGSSRSAFGLEQSGQTKALVDACAETALQQIKSSSSYTGSATLSFENGSCTYTVTGTGGSNRTIHASSTVDSLVRKVNVSITQVTPTITVSSWTEVADF